MTLPPPTGANNSRSARGAVEEYFFAWNTGHYELLDGLLSDGWVDHSHPDRRSAADVHRAFQSARETQPDTQVLIDAVLGDGDLITVNGRIVTGDRVNRRVWIVKTEGTRLREIWTHMVD
jgi:predicted SnoaL-like aldol condensation-catalyzing enzyme